MKGKLMKVRKKPLAIEYVKTSELVPYAGNAKEHPADPKYIDVIIERWENMTGKKAVLVNG